MGSRESVRFCAPRFGATGSRAVWQTGDFDYDGRVGAGDLMLLRGNYGDRVPIGAAGTAGQFGAVPEPGGAAAVPSLAAFTLRRRRRESTELRS
jgi:hypothetical protein